MLGRSGLLAFPEARPRSELDEQVGVAEGVVDARWVCSTLPNHSYGKESISVSPTGRPMTAAAQLLMQSPLPANTVSSS